MKKTILILLSLFTLALTGNSYATLSSKGSLSGGLIFDYASVIKNKNSLNAHLRTLHKFADIEMIVVNLSDLEGDDIDGLTSRLIHFDMRNRFHLTLFRNPYLELFRNAYTFGVTGFMYFKGEPPPYIGVNVWEGSTRKAKIRSMVKDGPTDRAGLKQGDVIIRIGDIEVKTTSDVVRAMRKYQIGDIVKVKVKRGLIPRTVMLTLEAFDLYAEDGTQVLYLELYPWNINKIAW